MKNQFPTGEELQLDKPMPTRTNMNPEINGRYEGKPCINETHIKSPKLHTSKNILFKQGRYSIDKGRKSTMKYWDILHLQQESIIFRHGGEGFSIQMGVGV